MKEIKLFRAQKPHLRGRHFRTIKHYENMRRCKTQMHLISAVA